jgi:ABC-type glutathione transport system ATPase component
VPSSVAPLTIITIRNVSNIYVSRSFGLFGKKEIKPVLNNVNLDIAEGEIVGLTGESGCGKTTLARCILGLIGYTGEITVNGPAQMVFQDPGASLNPAIKIGRLMEEPLIIHRKDNHSTAHQRSIKVDETLARVGLDPSYKTRRVHELSGGQKQRVCIGRALITSSKILIADEAASALDVSAGAQILNLFRELRQNLALTVLFISHSTYAVEYLCDRVVVMKNGNIEPLRP